MDLNTFSCRIEDVAQHSPSDNNMVSMGRTSRYDMSLEFGLLLSTLLNMNSCRFLVSPPSVLVTVSNLSSSLGDERVYVCPIKTT